MFRDRSALITGASSGIGAALAMEFARVGAALILVARREERLRKLSGVCKSLGSPKVEHIAADLADPAGVSQVVGQANPQNRVIDVLVNCAGVGEYGRFIDQDPVALDGMIRLNITALASLTRSYLPGMLQRASGWVLNVASTAAFQPTPYMALYGGTKSLVLDFSMAIGEELRGSGVQVSCLCPGPVRTEFFDRGGYEERSADFQRFACTAEFVARKAMKGLIGGKRVIIPGWLNKVSAWSVRLGTLNSVTRISAKLLGPVARIR